MSTRGWRLAAGIVLAWTTVAVLLSLQGHVTSVSQGRPQPWWPSLGYSLAIFSIWAAITLPVLAAVRRIETSGWSAGLRAAAYGAGVLVVGALHVGLFAAVYWPVYNDGGRIASPWAMAERMFVRNLGTNVLFYGALVAAGILARRRPDPPPAPEMLRARSRGAVRLVPLDQVSWIGAAGNYAEAHTGEDAVLIDEPLAALAARLPAERFARIHRRAIVRLDRIAQVRSLGRGDAEVALTDGTVLRLSRRYRSALAAWLNGG